MKRIFISVFFFTIITKVIICQEIQINEPENNFRKNMVYLTGSISGYYLLNYERQVYKIGKEKDGSLNIAVTFGRCKEFALSFNGHDRSDQKVTTLMVSASFISRGNKSHIESAAGIFLNSEELVVSGIGVSGLAPKIGPCVSLGYRFQTKKFQFMKYTPFIFRTGIGYPQIVYLSFGFAF